MGPVLKALTLLSLILAAVIIPSGCKKQSSPAVPVFTQAITPAFTCTTAPTGSATPVNTTILSATPTASAINTNTRTRTISPTSTRTITDTRTQTLTFTNTPTTTITMTPTLTYTPGGPVRMKQITDYNASGVHTYDEYFTYNAQGGIVDYECYDTSNAKIVRIWYQYDANNRIIRKDSEYEGVENSFLEYAYEGNTNTITQTNLFSFSTGLRLRYYVFTYDTGGLLTRKDGYLNNGTQFSYWTYEHDPAGNITKESDYSSTGTYQGEERYEYNASGRMTKYSIYDSTGMLYLYTTTTYDMDGNQLSWASYDPPATLVTYGDFVNEFGYSAMDLTFNRIHDNVYSSGI